jgi:hypothetical protein
MTPARVVRCLLAALLSSLLAAPLYSADRPWRELKTERYTVISQLPDADTRRWAEEYDEFIASVLEITRFRPDALPPLTVVLFRHNRDFAPFKPPRPNGKQADDVAGFFLRRETWGVIGMAETSEADATRSTIFHEGVHWITSVDRSPQPTWFSEGLAEIFSTFGPKVTKVHLADPILPHLALLRQNALMPMSAFLSQQGSLFDRDAHTSLYYAQAWAFVHYLLFSGDPQRREQLGRYLQAYRTKSAEEAASIAFGPDLAPLEKALNHYVEQPTMGSLLLPRHKTAPLGAISDAAPVAVEIAQGRLALYSTDTQLAARYAERAEALDPQGAAIHELRSYIAMRDQDPDTAMSEAQKALQGGSRDAQMFLLAAEAVQRANYGSASERVQRRVDLCEQAIGLNPTYLMAYEHLVGAVTAMQKPTQREMQYLKVGQAIFPQDPGLLVGLAVAEYKLGQTEEAYARLDAVLRPDSGMESSQRLYAQDLKSSWRLAELQEGVEPLMNSRKFPEALKFIDGYADKVEGRIALDYLASLRRTIVLQQAVASANDTQRAGHLAEARKQYEALLGQPNLPDDLRQYLQRAIESLKRAR